MSSCTIIKRAPSRNPPMQSPTPALEMARKFSLSRLRRGLPTPSYSEQLPAHMKKSHAKRQPKDHVPRPRNAFMLFRSDFVRQKKVPEDVENDQGNISRIAGRIWRHMGDTEKKPWVDMAKAEKECHARNHPNYRYAPLGPRRKPVKKGKGVESSGFLEEESGREGRDVERVRPREREHERERPKIEANWGDISLPISLPVRRSSSCPPGATRIPTALLEAQQAIHDDIASARRPSRVTYYQSTPIGSEQIIPPNPHTRCSNQWNTMNVGPFAHQPEVYQRWDVPVQEPLEWTSWAQPPAYDAVQDMSAFNYATNTDIWSVPNPFLLPPLDHPAPLPDPIAPTDMSPLMAMPPQPPALAPSTNAATATESVNPLAPAYHAPPSLDTSYLPQDSALYGAGAGADTGFTGIIAGPTDLSFTGSGVDFSSDLEFGTDYDFSAYTTDNAFDFFNNANATIDFSAPFDEKFAEPLFPVDFGFVVGGPERDIEVMLPGLTLGAGDVQR